MNSDIVETRMFGDVADSAALGAPYRVLARKYRPSSFADLIGQEPMVRTLTNAFALNRVHQAYIFTGVRGIGKTTTARILARAFNYQLPGAPAKPSVEMPVLGVHCQAIIDSRHVDVIEMDAASHTGIDDIREVTENARYLPVMAAKKVYIIDEVHMLSKQAFNGLLKTLEEPPEHVRFIFATTEIEKVPITVRSRCQRFDLRRIDTEMMVAHLAGICRKESVNVETEALAMIARASEGSVRDALSLLDQAIAHGSNTAGVQAETLRAMLGLADRGRIIDLFEAVMKGDASNALTALKEQYDSGADPTQILTELAEFVHFVTRLKLVPSAALDQSVTQAERERGLTFSIALSLPILTRAWQILSKGIAEMTDTPRPIASADMVLVRLCFAADLPTPEELLRKISSTTANAALSGNVPPRGGISGSPNRMVVNGASQIQSFPANIPAAPTIQLTKIEDLAALAGANRDIQLKTAIERDIRLLRLEPGVLEFSLAPGAPSQIAQTLTRRLQEWTGERWMVAVSAREGSPTLKEMADAREAKARTGIEANPLVRSVLEFFPGAKIVAVRAGNSIGSESTQTDATLEASVVTNNDDVGYTDTLITEDDF